MDGSYPAGTITEPYGSSSLYQDVAETLASMVNGLAIGDVFLTYRHSALAFSNPYQAKVDQTYSQSVQISNGFSPTYPVTYQWFKDGVSIYGPGSNSSISTSFSSIGSHSVAVKVTDATGRVEQATKDVTVVYAGNCFHPPCP
jgi:hypothetical protein